MTDPDDRPDPPPDGHPVGRKVHSEFVRPAASQANQERVAAVLRFFSTGGLLIMTGGRTKGTQRGRLNWRHPLAVPAILAACMVIPVFLAWKLVSGVQTLIRWFRA